MEFKNLFDDKRAVSPVIGVILMVAITVILAAVIGTFVLGLGDQVQQTTPRASIGFDTGTVSVQEDAAGGGTQDVTAVTLTHENGDQLEQSNVDITVDGAQAYSKSTSGPDVAAAVTEGFSAGTSTTIIAAVDTATTVTDGEDFIYDTQDSAADGDAAGTLDIVENGETNGGTSVAPAPVENDVGLSSGETVRFIWSSDDGSTSSTLAKFTLP